MEPQDLSLPLSPVKWAQEWAERSSSWPWEHCFPPQGLLSFPSSTTALQTSPVPTPNLECAMVLGGVMGQGLNPVTFLGSQNTQCHQSPFWVPGPACAEHFIDTICQRDLFCTDYTIFQLKTLNRSRPHSLSPPIGPHMIHMEPVPSMLQPLWLFDRPTDQP